MLEDHRDQFGTNFTSLLDMDLAAKPLRDLDASNRNLKSILKCNSFRSGYFKACVMRSCRGILGSISGRAVGTQHCRNPAWWQASGLKQRMKCNVVRSQKNAEVEDWLNKCFMGFNRNFTLYYIRRFCGCFLFIPFVYMEILCTHSLNVNERRASGPRFQNSLSLSLF